MKRENGEMKRRWFSNSNPEDFNGEPTVSKWCRGSVNRTLNTFVNQRCLLTRTTCDTNISQLYNQYLLMDCPHITAKNVSTSCKHWLQARTEKVGYSGPDITKN